MPKQKIEISPSIIIYALSALMGLYFLFSIRTVLILLFLAFILMTALNPAVTKINKKVKIPRPFSILIVYTLFVLILVGGTSIIIPPLIKELIQFLKTIHLPLIQDYIEDLKFSVSEIGGLATTVGSSLSMVISIVTSTFSSMLTFFTLLVLSFYMLIDRHNLHKKVGWFSNSEKHFQLSKRFLDETEHQLGGWVRGQLILMTVIGAITFTGLSLLSVPFALPLALMAALLEILPNLGPTIAAIPAAAIAFLTISPVMGVVVIIFYIVVQQLENYLLVPKIMKANANVNPLVSITSFMIGFTFFNVVGALIAIPVYIVLRVAFSEIWKGRKRE